MVLRMIEFCKKEAPILRSREVKQLCVVFNFDEALIHEYLSQYEPEEKYKGVAGYEWQET